MPPQRRQREYETAVDPDAIHAEPEKLAGFGEKRTVIKDAELNELRRFKQLAEQLQQQGASGLAVHSDGALLVHGFQLTPKGLIAPDSFSEDDWQQLGLLLLRLEGSIQFLIGDWVAYGDDVKWGDGPIFAEKFGRDYGTVRNYATVSRQVPLSFRNDKLSYTHHVVVAVDTLTTDQKRYALEYAAENNLSVAKFRQWLNGQLGKSLTPDHPLSHDFLSIAKEAGKFIQRDPSTLKIEDREAGLSYIARMRAVFDAWEAKARS